MSRLRTLFFVFAFLGIIGMVVFWIMSINISIHNLEYLWTWDNFHPTGWTPDSTWGYIFGSISCMIFYSIRNLKK